MKSQFKTLLRIAPVAVLILAFQNCSSPKFSTTDVASEKILANDGTSDTSTPADPSQPADTSNPPASNNNGGDDDKKKCDDKKDPAPASTSDQQWRNACEDLKKQVVSVADGASIKNLSGSKAFQAASFSHVDNNSGSTAILCTGKGGKVATLNDNSGNVLVCGCDVTEIRNKSGKLVVVGGDIGSIADSSGVIVIDGKIGQISNVSGAIRNH